MIPYDRLKRSLEEVDVLFSRHKDEVCPRDCIFCVQERIEFEAPMIIPVDRMLELHVIGHSKEIGYPFVEVCEYCRVEWMIGGVKGVIKS